MARQSRRPDLGYGAGRGASPAPKERAAQGGRPRNANPPSSPSNAPPRRPNASQPASNARPTSPRPGSPTRPPTPQPATPQPNRPMQRKFHGVNFVPDRGNYRVQISVNHKREFVGTFRDAEEAARAHDLFVLRAVREGRITARPLNFPASDYTDEEVNNAGRKIPPATASGLEGVTRFQRSSTASVRFRAYARVDGKLRHLGTFDTLEEAAMDRDDAMRDWVEDGTITPGMHNGRPYPMIHFPEPSDYWMAPGWQPPKPASKQPARPEQSR